MEKAPARGPQTLPPDQAFASTQEEQKKYVEQKNLLLMQRFRSFVIYFYSKILQLDFESTTNRHTWQPRESEDPVIAGVLRP